MVVATRGVVGGSAPGEAHSGELGKSSSVAAHGTVRPVGRRVSLGGTIRVSSESKKIQIVSWMGRGSKGEDCIIKDHMLGDHDAMSEQIKATIAFMVVGITEEVKAQRAKQAYEVLWLTCWG
jgi:hypothetical protein